MHEDPDWPRAAAWLAARAPRRGGAPLLGVVDVPLSQASISPSRAHETPAAIRGALRRFSTYCADLDVDIAAVDVDDVGALALAGVDNDAAQARIHAGLRPLRGRHDLLVLLGGDNAITRPALTALAPDLARAGLLTLDAHHDVRGFHAGRTNGTPVRGLLEDGLAGENVAQVGLGGFTNSRAYRRYCEEHGLTLVTAADARAEGVAACVTRLVADLAARCEWLYVDVDVDVLDAAFAPGCPGARPGGLTPWELHAAVSAAAAHPKVAALDIVEVDAVADARGGTVDAAALCLLHAAAGLVLREAAEMEAGVRGCGLP